MNALQSEPLTALYEADETAWLDAMAELVAQGRFAELDQIHLAEYLSDMAKRDRREVSNRLAQLLKWYFQPVKRTRSRERSIELQRQKLQQILDSATLRNHAEDHLAEMYAKAIRLVIIDTDLPVEAFPPVRPFDWPQIESAPLPRATA
jgi:hypothetical protein